MPGVDASAVPAPEKFPHGSGFCAVALAFLIVGYWLAYHPNQVTAAHLDGQ